MGERHHRAPIVPAVPAAQSAPERTASVDQPDVRLIIEESDRPGSYVYKTLDRRTGEVLQQFPREELLRMREDKTYLAGDVISANA